MCLIRPYTKAFHCMRVLQTVVRACRLDRQYSWGQYWNYLRRQLYVLDTYSNRHNRLLNHTMMWVHSWASLAFAAPVLLGEWHVERGRMRR